MARRTLVAGRPRVPQMWRFRRRLTIAFVLVAGVSAAALAIGAYALVHNARFAESLQRAESDVRFQLLVAREFLPLDNDRSARLLGSFEQSGRHVILVQGTQAVASNPGFDPPLSQRLRSVTASGQIGYERVVDAGRHLLVVGGRIPGCTSREGVGPTAPASTCSAELFVVFVEDRLHADLAQLAAALLGGWLGVVAVATLVGTVIARRTLGPVARASEAARAVAEGLLDTRLPAEGRDEFGAWAASFNRMAGALEAKIAALSAAQERERRFTADVAHELRTPVTALVAAASLLADSFDRLPAEARRPAELLVGDVLRLRRLVDELMEISRLSAGGEDVRRTEVDLTALVAAVLRRHGWDRSVRVEGEPVTLLSDERRLERIVANLVGNAVEHGDPGADGGGIAVRLRRDGQWVSMSVTDQGPGIAREHLPHLFERFYKVDTARSGGGSGLGLAIVRENVGLLGGSVEVSSNVGEGTQFRLRLPVTADPVPTRASTPRAPAGPVAAWPASAPPGPSAVTRLLRDGEAADELGADREVHEPLKGEAP
ncbi:HAMP domain-containing sensor histidine kinase [Actinopolymorpha sp. B17G11]|uniref:sensor histidine kinase n=1 Tax=unclassified Actinopolymorpha TaxID=2627063 RepID=UPI0032D96AC5